MKASIRRHTHTSNATKVQTHAHTRRDHPNCMSAHSPLHEYKLDAVDLGDALRTLSLDDALLDRFFESDSELARNSAFGLYKSALKDESSVPDRSSAYLKTVERTVLLEARELLRGANLRATEWTTLPSHDGTGEFSKHLLVASGEFGKTEKEKERKSVLLLAHHDRDSETYSTQMVTSNALRAFQSVEHRFAERDLQASWGRWVQLGERDFVCTSLGYIGDALATLAATELIRLQGRPSPLLRAVAAPSKRVSVEWRDPTDEHGLNGGQLDALGGLAHNLEAISGPPGTGKSTIISALVTQYVPRDSCAIVSAVQNRAIEVSALALPHYPDIGEHPSLLIIVCAQSIVQKLASTAATTPFVVHGNEKRLSPTSLQWTVKAQAERDPIYCNFLARKDKCKNMFDVLDQSLFVYKKHAFPALFSSDSRHSRSRKALRRRLDDRFRDGVAYETPEYADFVASAHLDGNAVTPSERKMRKREEHKRFLAWFDSGGGDGWKKLAEACVRHKFPVAAELHEYLRQQCADFEVSQSREFQEARERVCERALVLVCTCAAVGGLVRASPEHADCVDRLASRCTTLVVDEAGTCADSCIVPVLARNESGGTFERLVIVGDAKQLPCFTRLRDPLDAPVSLIERVDAVVGSALLTTQYRMFSKLCDLISSLYYEGRLVTGKLDPMGELKVHTIKGNAETEDWGTSIFNAPEARTAIALARGHLETGRGSVAVMAFYKAQVKKIAEALADTEAVVITVDASQGQEYDHVVLSCVVDGNRRSFLEDRRRMNVALSRAKLSLDVVMHPSLPRRISELQAVTAKAGVGGANEVAIGRPSVVVGTPVR
jgi:hypothetical protein